MSTSGDAARLERARKKLHSRGAATTQEAPPPAPVSASTRRKSTKSAPSVQQQAQQEPVPPPSKRQKVVVSRKGKEKAPRTVVAGPTPTESALAEGTNAEEDLLRSFEFFLADVDQMATLKAKAPQSESYLIRNYVRMGCVLQGFLKQKEEILQLSEQVRALSAEKEKMAEDIATKNSTLQLLGASISTTEGKLKEEKKALREQRRAMEALEASLPGQRQKAIDDFLASEKHQEDLDDMTVRLMDQIAEKFRRKVAPLLPGQDLQFLLESDDEGEGAPAAEGTGPEPIGPSQAGPSSAPGEGEQAPNFNLLPIPDVDLTFEDLP